MARRQNIWNYLLTVVLAATTGAAVTWLIISQGWTLKVPSFSTTQPPAVASAAPDVAGLSAGEAAVARGNIAYDQQQWAEAIRQYQDAIAKGVNSPDVITDLGNAFRFAGLPQQALDQYSIAQKLNPQHENSLFNQISLYSEVLKEPARAVPIAEDFMRRFPNSDKIPAVREQLARAKFNAP